MQPEGDLFLLVVLEEGLLVVSVVLEDEFVVLEEGLI